MINDDVIKKINSKKIFNISENIVIENDNKFYKIPNSLFKKFLYK